MSRKLDGDDNIPERFLEPAGWAWGSFTGGKGVRLRFGNLQTERPVAHIIYVEGLSEFAEKTFELAQDFNRHSCSFWVFDRHGQGLSGRFLKDEFKQHSEGFHDDAADLIAFIREIVPDDAPVVLLGHSTGGLIALLAAHDAPEGTIDGLAMTAPLLGFLDPLMNGRERVLAALPLPKNLLERYIPGGGSWKRRDDPSSLLKESDFSSDETRMKLQDYWLERMPGLRAGSPTVGWVKQACIAMMDVRSKHYLRSIDIPVFFFTAGQDALVENSHVSRAVDMLPSAQRLHFNKAKHELLMETDDIRNEVIERVAEFARRLPSRRFS